MLEESVSARSEGSVSRNSDERLDFNAIRNYLFHTTL